MYKTIKRVLNDYLVNENKIKFFTLILFSLIVFWVWIIEPFFMMKLVSLVENFLKTWNYSYDSFFYVFLLWWIFIIFLTLARWIISYWVSQLMLKSYNKIYLDNASKIIKMWYWDYLNKKQWEIYKIFDRWMEWWFFFTEMFIIRYLESIVSIFVIVIVLFYIDYRMSFAALAMVPVMFVIWYFINNKTLKKQKEVNDIRDNAFWLFWDSIWNLPLVKTLTLENKLLSKLKTKLSNWYNLQVKVTKRWTIWDIYTWFLVMVSRFLVLSLWIYFLINWSLTFSILFLFFSYIWYIYFPLSFLFNSLKNIQKQLTWIEKFHKLIDTLNIDSDNIKSSNLTLNWNIKFENVNFWYNKWIWILNWLSFKINSWEKVALVWNTWAWKSTITNLLFRFWEVDSWIIYFDWLKISDISKIDLRKNIWIVMQDNSLFNMSIRDNLSHSRDWVTEKDIIDALQKSEANFVFHLEKWLDTVIGERWLKLSWGQKQRLNIARLFLKNPKILILDEATSALDNKTEKLVQKALDELMKWRTSIVIAHRLSTIQNSDKIFMIENWKIVEEWKYDELMKKNWKFHNLANPKHLIL